jgi:hypothetical protein
VKSKSASIAAHTCPSSLLPGFSTNSSLFLGGMD